MNKRACAYEHEFSEFKKLFNVDFGTVDSVEHAGKVFDDCNVDE